MRHNKKHGMKLGTDASHTKAMKRSLTCALLANDRIKTLEPRAKAIRPDVDHVITWAKKGDLHSRRLAIKTVGDKEVVREVFEKAQQGLWKDRQGGYTRIMKLGKRKGDNSDVVIIELVNEAVKPKATADTVKPVAEPEPVAVEDRKDDAAEAAKNDEPAEDSVEDDTPAEETPTE